MDSIISTDIRNLNYFELRKIHIARNIPHNVKMQKIGNIDEFYSSGRCLCLDELLGILKKVGLIKVT